MQKWLNRSFCSLGCWVGWVQRTCITLGVDALTGMDTFGVSRWLKSIVKHWILRVGKRVSCARKGGPILVIYTLRDMFLHKELPFGVAVFAPALKFLEALIFSHYRNLTALKLVFLFKIDVYLNAHLTLAPAEFCIFPFKLVWWQILNHAQLQNCAETGVVVQACLVVYHVSWAVTVYACCHRIAHMLHHEIRRRLDVCVRRLYCWSCTCMFF